MRIFLLGAACVMTVCLSGCGEGSAFDNGLRSSFRDNQIQSCLAAARSTPAMIQLDWPRLCGCAVDRYMAGKSVAELRRADQQAVQAATQQCAMEQVRAAAGAPAAGKPGTGESPGEEGNAAKPAD